MKVPHIHTAYDPPGDPGISVFDASKTRQSEADSCDVNKIMARFERTGLLPQGPMMPQFLDVSNMPDYRAALDEVQAVDEYFRRLTATVRARFENDPAVFLEFAIDPANRRELGEMGLMEPVPEELAPVPAEPVVV